MNRELSRGLIGIVPACVLLSCLAGCGQGNARFTPSTDVARTSLEAALTAWRDGKPCGPVEGKPPVHAVDSVWQAGARMESFQIGEEEDLGDGTKQFVVKLTMKEAKASRESDVRYVVHGLEPVYVFREDDYKRALNMDNNPEPPRTRKASGRTRRGST